MMLYKYVPFDAGKRIIETATIGFSQPKYFNDPFDTPSYPRERSDNPAENLFGRIHLMSKEMSWSDNTGILSLTRTPTNPLMWAHYADKHRGMVIGIDVRAAGLTQEASNLIPAQYGSVIYVSHRSDEPFISTPGTGLAVGATHHFAHDHYEKLQRLFLHKPIHWSYEEEVRVLKCIKGIAPEGGETVSGKFKVIETEARNLYLLSLPPEALREVYFGFRLDIEESDDFFYRASELHPHLRFLECHLESDSFAVGARDYTTLAEAAAG